MTNIKNSLERSTVEIDIQKLLRIKIKEKRQIR